LKLVVTIRSYFATPDGEPKRYYPRRTLRPLAVDTKFSLLQLVDFIGETFIWGSKQYLKLWRCLDDDFVEIKTDEDLLQWFEVNMQKGVVRIEGEVHDFEGPLLFSPTKRRFHPKVRSRVVNGEPTLNISDPLRSKRRVAHDDSDTESLKALSDSSYDSDLAASSDSDLDFSDSEYDPDAEILDEDEDDDIPTFAYDVDNPCIDKDVMFPDVDACKSAVTHHAILHDYAYETVKKCKKRFRAKCKRADKGCKWQFFASTSKKYIGCMVI
jgi:hypothetical protein